MFFKCVLVALLATGAVARSTPSSQNSISNEIEKDSARSDDSYSYLSDFRYMYKVYQECASQDLTSCLKLKLVAAVDRAARAYSLNLIDGVSFVKEKKDETTPEAVQSEEEIEASLPRALDQKDNALNDLIFSKVGKFLDSHTLQVKLPSTTDIARSFEEEGRGKKKKGGALLLLPLILGGTLVPLALGALALLAGKALIVSKLALVLAGIIGLKKLLSGHGGHHESGHVEVVSGGHGGGGWGRSYDKDEAQKMAYQAYVQKQR